MDYDAPRWILNWIDAAGKLARWQRRLFELDFKVVKPAGVKYQAADVHHACIRQEGTNPPLGMKYLY